MKLKRIIVFLILFSYISINAKMNVNYEDARKGIASYFNHNKLNNKIFYINGDSNYGGFISKEEYDISGGKKSYLFDGGNYWTATKENNKRYVVKSDSLKLEEESRINGVRITEYINNDGVSISGLGTYTTPWKPSVEILAPKVTIESVSPDAETYSQEKEIDILVSGNGSRIIDNQTLEYVFIKGTAPEEDACEVAANVNYTQATLTNDTPYSARVTINVDDSNLTGTYYMCLKPTIKNEYGQRNNSNDLASYTFNFDNKAPNITFGPNGNTESEVKHDVLVTIQDNESGLKAENANSGWSNSSTSVTETYDIHIEDGAKESWLSTKIGPGLNGNYYLHVINVCDNAGNCASKVSNSFKVHTEYTIKYHANGGSGTMTDTVCKFGTQCNLRNNELEKQDYMFIGWSTIPTGTIEYSNGQAVSNLTSINGGIVNLYAQWKSKNYTLYYNCNTGSGTAPSPTQCDINGSCTLSSGDECGITIIAGTNGSVRTVVGWKNPYTNDTYTAGENYNGPSDTMTLTAVYGDLFTYTGSKNVIKDSNQNWRVEFLETGTLTFNKKYNIDIHAVGGGGGGGAGGSKPWNPDSGLYATYTAGGGGGGYTETKKNYNISKGLYTITIGAGGEGGTEINQQNGKRGGSTSIKSNGSNILIAEGGYGGEKAINDSNSPTGRKGGNGGNGGSGGGAGTVQSNSPGSGGFNGSDGTNAYKGSLEGNEGNPGQGQRRKTTDFGENNGTLRGSGGGAGGKYMRLLGNPDADPYNEQDFANKPCYEWANGNNSYSSYGISCNSSSSVIEKYECCIRHNSETMGFYGFGGPGAGNGNAGKGNRCVKSDVLVGNYPLSQYSIYNSIINPLNGKPNFGGGGGGAGLRVGINDNAFHPCGKAGDGGSGILIIRNRR